MDWPEIQAAAAAAAALEACTSTNSAAGDGSIDSYTAGAMATAFVDGYTFNTVGWRLVDTLDRVVALWEGGVGVPVWCICIVHLSTVHDMSDFIHISATGTVGAPGLGAYWSWRVLRRRSANTATPAQG